MSPLQPLPPPTPPGVSPRPRVSPAIPLSSESARIWGQRSRAWSSAPPPSCSGRQLQLYDGGSGWLLYLPDLTLTSIGPLSGEGKRVVTCLAG